VVTCTNANKVIPQSYTDPVTIQALICGELTAATTRDQRIGKSKKGSARQKRGEQCSKGHIAIDHHIQLLLTASPHIPSPSSSLTAPPL